MQQHFFAAGSHKHSACFLIQSVSPGKTGGRVSRLRKPNITRQAINQGDRNLWTRDGQIECKGLEILSFSRETSFLYIISTAAGKPTLAQNSHLLVLCTFLIPKGDTAEENLLMLTVLYTGALSLKIRITTL